MQDKWSEFLTQQDARQSLTGEWVLDDSRHCIAALPASACIISLEHLGVVRVTGDDAKSFLQGQLTNDIHLLNDNRIQLSGYCNPKGRLLAQFIVIPEGDDILLLIPKSIKDKTMQRLRMYILRSKVEITDLSGTLTCLGIAGEQLQGVTDAQLGSLPGENNDLSIHDGQRVVRFPGTIEQYLCVMETERAINLWLSLKERMTPASAQVWHWLDIQAGIPCILPETVEEFVPQMVNLELIGGVSFKKGCYTGQEIVARMHYLGKAKRRMFRLHQSTEELPPPGSDIFDAKGDNQSVGKVVMAAPSPGQGVDLLAVLQLSHTEAAQLHLGSIDGPLLILETLPYSITEKD